LATEIQGAKAGEADETCFAPSGVIQGRVMKLDFDKKIKKQSAGLEYA